MHTEFNFAHSHERNSAVHPGEIPKSFYYLVWITIYILNLAEVGMRIILSISADAHGILYILGVFLVLVHSSLISFG